MILAIDLGTSVTKAGLWNEDGLVATGHADLHTAYGPGGRAEQDPVTWWPSLVAACRAAGAKAVDAVVFSAARQTFVPVTGEGKPLGPALLWSDRRAVEEAAALGGRQDGASVAAKIRWLAAHEPDRLAAARWLLSPRDLVVLQLTGEVATDTTLASAAGAPDGDCRLPDPVEPTTVVGRLQPEAARALELSPGVPIILGAGDRQCEVLGTGASARWPMVAWGTTANVSVPAVARPDPVPAALSVTRGALGGWLLEGGLSAAGSLLAWIGTLTGQAPEALARLAMTSPPGAGGVVSLPWPGGARAPWWRDRAGAGFFGLGLEHGPADLARAVFEGVAFDVARCLEAAGTGAEGLALGGSSPAWVEVLTGVTGLPARRRRSGQAAMAGAVLVASVALGAGYRLDRFDPVVEETAPAAELTKLYRPVRRLADQLAAAALGVTE